MFKIEQEKKIIEVMQKYNTDLDYKVRLEDNYLNKPTELNMLQIYVLEELVRFGNNNYFNKFFDARQNDKQDIFNEYDVLINLCKSNRDFLDSEIDKLNNNIGSLSKLEMFVITNFFKDEINNKKKEEVKSKEKDNINKNTSNNKSKNMEEYFNNIFNIEDFYGMFDGIDDPLGLFKRKK